MCPRSHSKYQNCTVNPSKEEWVTPGESSKWHLILELSVSSCRLRTAMGWNGPSPGGRKEAPFLQTETETQTKMTHRSSSHRQDASKHIKPPVAGWAFLWLRCALILLECSDKEIHHCLYKCFFNEKKKALFTHGDFCSNTEFYFNFLVVSIVVSHCLKQWPQIPLCLHCSDNVVTAE